MVESLQLLVAEVPPEESVNWLAKGGIVLLLLAGTVKCFKIMRRPTTHTLCVLSLAVFLVTWTASGLLNVLVESPYAAIAVAVAAGVGAIVTLVLAIVGLVDYSQQRSKYQQGRTQAGWAIFGSLVIVGLFVVGFLNQISESSVSRIDLRDAPAHVTSNKNLNFRLRPVGTKWVPVDAKALNPDASAAYLRRDPDMYFFVIAERAGADSGFGKDTLLAISHAKLRSADANARFYTREHEAIDGIDGFRYEADVTTNGEKIRFSNWVGIRNGYSYQLIAFSAQKDREKLSKIARAMANGFEQINPQDVIFSAGTEQLDVHHSEQYGYRVDVSDDPGWFLPSNGEADFPTADLVAARLVDAETIYCIIQPLALGDVKLEPSIWLGGIAGASLAFSNADELSRRATAVKVDAADVAAYEVVGDEKIGQDPYAYRMRLYRGNDFAFLVAGWWRRDSISSAQAVAGFIENFELLSHSRSTKFSDQQKAEQIGLIYNEVSLHAFNRGEFAASAELFRMALELRSDPAIVENLVSALLELGQKRDALKALDEYSMLVAANTDLGVTQAALAATLGDTARATSLYRQAFRNGHVDDDLLFDYLKLEVEQEEYDQAIQVAESYARRQESPLVRRWIASIRSVKGDHDESIRELGKLSEANPDDVDTTLALARALRRASRYNEAIERCNHVISKTTANSEAFFVRGECEFELEWYAKARSSFERVMEISPGDEEAREYHQAIAALIGRGDRTRIDKPVELVALPPTVESIVQRATEASSLRDPDGSFDAIGLYRVTGISYRKGDHRRISIYRKTKVLTRTGVDSNSTLTFSFNPLFERVYVNRLVVTDQAGEVVAEGSSDNYYVLDDTDAEMATEDRVLHVPVPHLKPGYSVELVLTSEYTDEPEDFGYYSSFIASADPLHVGVVFLTGDLSEVDAIASQVKREVTQSSLAVWSVTKPTPYEWEPKQIGLEYFLPYVLLADKGRTWESEANDYFDKIRESLAPDDSTSALSRSLTSEAVSPIEKIDVLAAHVQKECTYRAIEFGVRSQIPNTAAATRKNGYGDCKDHAVWLMQLLRAVDIDARLALIKSTGPLVKKLVTLEQFDHMIVHVESQDPEHPVIFVDTTEKFTNPMLPFSDGLQNKFALVLDPDNPELVRTPDYGEDAAVVKADRIIEFSPPQDAKHVDLTIRETLSLNPYCSSTLRAFLQNYNRRERRQAMAELYEQYTKIRIEDLKVENLDQPSRDLIVHCVYRVPKALRAVSSDFDSRRFVGTLPAPWEQYLLGESFDDARSTPFSQSMPLRIETSLAFRSQPSWNVELRSDSPPRGESKYARWNFATIEGPDDLNLTSTIYRAQRVFSAQEYEDYYEQSRSALAAVEQTVELRSDP